MAKRRTGLFTRRLLKGVLIALSAILMVVVVYVLAGATDGMVAGWSAPLKAVVGVGLVVVVLTVRRFFARDLAEVDLARVRAAARSSEGTDVPAASVPAHRIASIAPDHPTATGDMRTARRSPGDATTLATFLAARTALLDVIASIDMPATTALEPNTRDLLAINTGVKHSESSLARSTADLQEAARQIADVCALVAERMEVDLLDRQAFADALMVLAQRARPSVATRPSLRARSVPATANRDRLVLVNGNAGSSAVPSSR